MVRKVGRGGGVSSDRDTLKPLGGVAVKLVEKGGSSVSLLMPVGGSRGNMVASVGV